MYALIEGYAVAPRLITECVQGIYDSEESVDEFVNRLMEHIENNHWKV